ncbi:MAG: hypothetical protein AAGC55_10610 [Myxococcota bacterium]
MTIALALVPACGDDSSDNDDGDGDGGSSADGGSGDAGSGGGDDAAPGDGGAVDPDGFATLISGAWTLGPGTEDYYCARRTVTEDLYITEFRSTAPPGTHHSVLLIDSGSQPDGITPCSAQVLSPRMIYSAGINTNDIALPDGVAMRVRAGQQLLLHLHLYNVTDAPLSGESAVKVATTTAAEIRHEAETVLMGNLFSLLIPPGPSTQVGSCTMSDDVELFMVYPHMHQLGTRMRVMAERSDGSEELLYDAPFAFEEQSISPIDPIALRQGERIIVYCSYNNTTGETVYYGDSSDQEMCFAGMYRYPAVGSPLGYICADN